MCVKRGERFGGGGGEVTFLDLVCLVENDCAGCCVIGKLAGRTGNVGGRGRAGGTGAVGRRQQIFFFFF